MADKSIVELPGALEMTDDALTALYQNGETASIVGDADLAAQSAQDAAAAKATAETKASEAAASAKAAAESAATAAEIVGGDFLTKTGDGKDVTVSFTEAESRANVATGEKLSVLFGKVAKWFAGLGSLAFKSTVAKSDLASGVQTSLGRADTALQSESDPTVPAWAKAATKPGYTFSEIAEKPGSYPPTAHAGAHAAGGVDELTPGAIGAARRKRWTAITVAVTDWAQDSASGYYYATVAVDDMWATDNPHSVDIVRTADAEANALCEEAFALVDRITTADGSITLQAPEGAPEVAFQLWMEASR